MADETQRQATAEAPAEAPPPAAPAAPASAPTPGPRGGRGPGGPREGGRKYFRRKQVCKFCVEKLDSIDYKDHLLPPQIVARLCKILTRPHLWPVKVDYAAALR